ncbi:DUF3341 domain-containing protein [candidate division GN15 bacterium]|nr:DUF3341 domain-containing protein [candidate division GN15 bacterium]
MADLTTEATMGESATEAPEKTYGVLAHFDTPGDLLHAAEKVRDSEYEKWDCHSPFPIHGMDAAMGLKRSPVGYIAGICAFLGGAFALWLQWWTSSVAYPMIIAGKPFNSYQAFVVVTFGLTVLGAALGAVFGMLIINRLPRLFHGNFYSKSFHKVSDDGFVVSIEGDDPSFDEQKAADFLRSIGGKNVEVVRGA